MSHLFENSQDCHRIHGSDHTTECEDVVDVHGGVEIGCVSVIEAECEDGGGEAGAQYGQGQDRGQLGEEGGVVHGV